MKMELDGVLQFESVSTQRININIFEERRKHIFKQPKGRMSKSKVMKPNGILLELIYFIET